MFRKIITSCLLAMMFFPLHAKARRPVPGKTSDTYNLTKAEPVLISAKQTLLPLIIYGESRGAVSSYVPSGYMGDSTSIKIKNADFSAPLLSSTYTGTQCLRVEIRARGRQGWAGVYWQTPSNNWGKVKGAGYNLVQANKLTFWIRGEKGGERITEIKFGGLVGPYPDTDSVGIGPLTLKKEWTMYTLDLTGRDLRHISGPFVFITRRTDNPRGAVFYLDEMIIQVSSVTAPVPVVQEEPETVPSAGRFPIPPAVPPASVSTKMTKSSIIVIPFANAKAGFGKSEKESLDEMAASFQVSPNAMLLVEGHTDNVGSPSLNKKLSEQRAKTVADYLSSKGVPRERMTVIGRGEEKPIRPGSNDTPQGRADNRRVEVSLVQP